MKIIRILFGIIIIVIIGFMIHILYGETNPPKSVFVDVITVSDNKIDLKGSVEPGSATVYRGYNVAYKNEILYIKVRLGLALGSLVPFLHLRETPDFNISIDKNKYGTIKEIYLQGDSPSDNLLIWPKE